MPWHVREEKNIWKIMGAMRQIGKFSGLTGQCSMSEALLNLLVTIRWVNVGCSSAMSEGQDVGVLLRNTVNSVRLMPHLG